MTGGKHTPGPWSAFVVEDTMTVSVDIGPHPSGYRPNVVDWTGFDTCGLPFDQQVANARLIAAAPDLLAALKQFRTKVYNAALGSGMDDEWATVACSVADAAIAKAEGGAE